MKDIIYHSGAIPVPDESDTGMLWGSLRERKYNRWAFRNIDKVLPHDVIQKSCSPLDLPRKFININEIKFYGDEQNLYRVKEALDYLVVDAVVVIKMGLIVNEQYFAGMKQSTPHILFSASKPWAGVIIANLIHDGLIKQEHDLVTAYLPELVDTAFSTVTIRQLLDMQSGIDLDDVDDPKLYQRASGFAPPKSGENILNTALMMQNSKFPPGEKTDYNSLNTDILSLLATRITGKPSSKIIEDIFERMGAEFDAMLVKDPDGISELGGGLAITARDLAKLGLAMLQDGWIDDQQVFPVGYINHILETAEPEKWEGSWLARLTPQAKAYRWHWYICADVFDEGSCFAVGNYGNALYINPKNQVVIALLSSQPQVLDIPRFNTQMAMLEGISSQV